MNFSSLIDDTWMHIAVHGWTWATFKLEAFWKNSLRYVPKGYKYRYNFPLLLICSTPILGMFSCHNLVLFLLYNKILLDICFTCVVFLFLFFLFHVLDLELGLPSFSCWLKNCIVLIVFVALTLLTPTCTTLVDIVS